MATKIGGNDLPNVVDGLDELERVVDTTSGSAWSAITCTSVRELFALEARRKADTHGTVQTASPTTPATHQKARKFRSPRAALPLVQKGITRNTARHTRNSLPSCSRSSRSDAATSHIVREDGGRAAQRGATNTPEPPRTPVRATGGLPGSAAAAPLLFEAQELGTEANTRRQRRAFALRIVARIRAVDAWVRFGSGLRTSAAAAATEPTWLALASATLATAPLPVPSQPVPPPLPSPPVRSGGRQRRRARQRKQRRCERAEDFLEYFCEVVCNGVPMALQRSEYYRRQAAGQLEGPDAPFPFEEEIAKQIHARSIAQARAA